MHMRCHWHTIYRLAATGLVVVALHLVASADGADDAEKAARPVSFTLITVDDDSTERVLKGPYRFALRRAEEKWQSKWPEAREGTESVEVDLTPGTWHVSFEPGRHSYWLEQDIEVPAGAGVHRIALRLKTTAYHPLKGRLVRADNGKPLAGLRVSIPGNEPAVTDQRGCFEAKCLWEHNENVISTSDWDIDGTAKRVVTLEELRAESLVWKVEMLPPAPIVEIQLMIEQGGKLVPFVDPGGADKSTRKYRHRFVQVRRSNVDPQTGEFRGAMHDDQRLVDHGGLCVAKRLSPGKYVVLRIGVYEGSADHPVIYSPVGGDLAFEVPDEQVERKIVLKTAVAPGRTQPRSVTIAGVVTDAQTGKPVQGAHVSTANRSWPGKLQSLEPPDTLHAVTDDEGAFSFQVPVSFQNVQVKRQRERYTGASRILYAVADETVNLQVIPLYTVSGKAVDADGNPPRFLMADLVPTGDERGARCSLDTDARTGAFICRWVKPGTYRLVVSNGYLSATHVSDLEVQADVTGMRVQLEKGTRISGHVIYDEGVDLPPRRWLNFVDPKTGIAEGDHVEIAGDGTYATRLNGKALTVYLRAETMGDPGEGSSIRCKLGEITIGADPATIDFHVTKEVLETAVSPQQHPFD